MKLSDEMHSYFNASLWPEERKKLAELANKSSGEFIIEIGVFRGHTTKYLLENTRKKIIAIDPYDMKDNNNEDVKKEFLDSCVDYIRSGRLVHIPKYSTEAHPHMTPYMVNNCALVFVDWDANAEQHYRDFIDYTPYIAKDGYLAAHDFYDNGTVGKHVNISEAITNYMKYIDKPITWETILYYPKHSHMSELMLHYGGSPDFFYVNRSRGLIWCSPNTDV